MSDIDGNAGRVAGASVGTRVTNAKGRKSRASTERRCYRSELNGEARSETGR